MITDILTMMWKERKELFSERETLRGTVASLLGPLFLVGMMGVGLPWQLGRMWVESAVPVAAAVMVSLMFGGMTAAAIAGERERHTLEALLASRLPDEAILFGKVGMAVCFASGSAMVALLVGLVTVNATHWSGDVLVYSPAVAAASLGLSLLVSTLAASMGVFVSMRAETVREAEQNIMALVAVVPVVLLVVPVLILRSVPWLEARFAELMNGLDGTQVLLAVMVVLVVLDAGFLMGAIRRFHRAKLIVS